MFFKTSFLKKYAKNEIKNTIEQICQQMPSGTLYINAETEIVPRQKTISAIAIVQNGQLTYLDFDIPSAEEFVKDISKTFNAKRIDFAIRFFSKQSRNQLSIRVLLEQVIKIKLLSWEQIDKFVYNRALQVLKQLLPYPGTIRYEPTIKFELSDGKNWRGVNWLKLTEELSDRQEQHTQLTSAIRSINSVSQNSEIPIILAVDDSPTIQMLIKFALDREYQVLTASSVPEAMKILAQKNVALVVSDVDMPEISGLEMCRMMRGLSKFRNLPIILLTGKDGFADRMRGQIAGSNKYLTKPFNENILREEVRQLLVA